MTHQIPYADYVRIEIHTAGKAEIIEWRPDHWGKVKAQVVVDDMPTRDIAYGGLVREIPSGDVSMTLNVSGPTATLTVKDVEATP